MSGFEQTALLGSWGGLSADPQCFSRKKTFSWLALVGMILAMAWQLQERGPDGEVGIGERLPLCPQAGPFADPG